MALQPESRSGLGGLLRRLLSSAARRALFLLVLVLGAGLVTTAWADSRHKGRVAPDLENRSKTESPLEMVPLVATLDGADPGAVAARVAELGGRMHGHYKN